MSEQPTALLAGLPDEEVRLLLRKRKKSRQGGTSCFPCKKRKVKCDRCSPCNNCATRGYPELCSFSEDPAIPSGLSSSINSKRSKPSNAYAEILPAAGQAGEDIDNSATRTHGPQRNSNPSLHYESDSHIQSDNNRQEALGNVFPLRPTMGSSSVTLPTEEVSALPEASSSVIRDAMVPMLGLRESNSLHPALLLNQHTWNKSLAEVQQTLPVDRDIIRYR